MAFTLELYSQDPTLMILELVGSITSQEMEEHLTGIETLLREHGLEDNKLYLLIDASRVSMDFPSVIEGSKMHISRRRGSASDPKTQGVFVSQDQMIQLLRDLMAKNAPGAYVPIFEERDKALEYIQQLAEVDRKRAEQQEES